MFFCLATCFTLSFFAAPVKRSHIGYYTSKDKKVTQPYYFNKAGLSLFADRQAKNTGRFIHFQNVQSSFTTVSHYIAVPYFLISVSGNVPWVMLIIRNVERVLKDHFLHLFSSHYFW